MPGSVAIATPLYAAFCGALLSVLILAAWFATRVYVLAAGLCGFATEITREKKG